MEELDSPVKYAFDEIPEAPGTLSKSARQHWNRLIPTIVDLGSARRQALILLGDFGLVPNKYTANRLV